jgi:RHS repeat-associated protein
MLINHYNDTQNNIALKTGTDDIIYNTTFNKTKCLTTLTSSDYKVNEISYDANNNRIIQKNYYDQISRNPNNNLDKKTTYYINKGYEVIHTKDKHKNNIIIHRHNIYVNGKVVATYDKTTINGIKAVYQAAYMHTDALGNIVTVTGNDGEIRLRQATTPFGETIKKGSVVLMGPATGHFKKEDLRGYTGHEQLPEHNIINMNARLYDPLIARMLSADSIIPNSKDPLAYNRYIYTYNNPVKYVDPDGHEPLFLLGLALMTISVTTDDPTIAKLTGLAGMLIMGKGLGEGGLGLTYAQSGAVIGFTNATLQSGGDLGKGLKGAISGYIMGNITDKYGENYDFERVAVSTIAGGAASEIMGGNFKDGANSNFITSSMAFLYDKVVGRPIDPKSGEKVRYANSDGTPSDDDAMVAGY